MMLESGVDMDLFDAAAQGHLEVVRLPLEFRAGFGYHIDDALEDGRTPLIVAAAAGHAEVVGLLLEFGADPEQAAHAAMGTTALIEAAERGHVEVARFLLEFGADSNHPRADGATCLLMAAQNGHLDMVHLLLESGADRDRGVRSGCHFLTPWIVASLNGHCEVASLLLMV